MKLDKEIIVEFVDEDISGILAEQNRKKFIEELNSLELKYNLENMVKYASYLNENLTFPLTGYYTIDNGMFGEEKVKLEISEIIEKKSRQGVKCLCKTPGNSTQRVLLHLIEIEEPNKNKELIDHFKKWYFKN